MIGCEYIKICEDPKIAELTLDKDYVDQLNELCTGCGQDSCSKYQKFKISRVKNDN